MTKWTALVALLLFVPLACSHRVSINTNPPGAKVYVNDNMIGESPASFVEKSGFGKSYDVRVEKEGYQTFQTTESQEINVLYLVLALVVCFPAILWSMTLQDSYTYTLQRA